jgi:hypothetical protein
MKVAVIDGGVAGLSGAIHSRAQGHDVTLYEKQKSVGGRIRESRNNGYTFDHCIAAVDYSLTQTMLGRPAVHTAAHACFAVCLGTDKIDLPHHSFIIPGNYEKGHRRIDDGKLPDDFLIYAYCTAESCTGDHGPG